MVYQFHPHLNGPLKFSYRKVIFDKLDLIYYILSVFKEMLH